MTIATPRTDGGGEWEDIQSEEKPVQHSSRQEAMIEDELKLQDLQDEEERQEQVDAAVQENVQDMLKVVEDLLVLEDHQKSKNGNIIGGSSASSVASESGGAGDEGISSSTSTSSTRRESKLKLRRRLRAAREKLKNSLNLQHKVVKPVALASVQATRRILTGHKGTRVRDYVVLPKVVRVLDKYTFTGGIMGMLLTEYIMLEYPHFFKYYNLIIMLPLLLLRVVLFKRTKQQFFLLDYCYWVNALGFCLAILPNLPIGNSTNIFLHWLSHPATCNVIGQVLFISANGPLFFALIAWNNSLVFHSVDKVTSTYVHVFPAILSWCERWHTPNGPIYYPTSDTDYPLTWIQHLVYPLLFYIIWQVVYLLLTEYWFLPVLDSDPDLSTSLRYLARAQKMSINRSTLKFCRAIGIMGPQETFHPPTLKVKAIFVILQMVMTLFTFLPVALFYNYQSLHVMAILGVFFFSILNGARYYIQVFSKIYDKRYSDGGPEEEYVDTGAVMAEHSSEPDKNNDEGKKQA